MIGFKQFLFEASSGAAKWDKYFGGSDVETIAKNDSQLYDAFGKLTKKIVKKGDPITVLAGEYNSKPSIRYQNGTYSMKFIDIEKPFKVDLAVKGNLKPDQIGIFGAIRMSEYNDKVKALLDDHSGIPEPQTEYLKALLDLAENMDDEDTLDVVRDLYITAEVQNDNALKATINNDFMEVLGPWFVINEKPGFAAGGVKFPEAGNEPLYDFTMKLDGVIYSFSSKRSGGRTNTLKVTEVVKAAEADRTLKKKYARELEVLHIIQDNPVKTAPGLLNVWLHNNYPAYETQPAPIDNTTIARLEAYVAKFMNEKSDLNFTPLVQSAVPDLWYVKSRLNNDGTLKVEPLVSGRDLGKVSLRSKSSPGHLTDKLGFAL